MWAEVSRGCGERAIVRKCVVGGKHGTQSHTNASTVALNLNERTTMNNNDLQTTHEYPIN